MVAIFTTNIDAKNQTLINHPETSGSAEHLTATFAKRLFVFPPVVVTPS
jgi:hypothetical protein